MNPSRIQTRISKVLGIGGDWEYINQAQCRHCQEWFLENDIELSEDGFGYCPKHYAQAEKEWDEGSEKREAIRIVEYNKKRSDNFWHQHLINGVRK